ncbi:IclR family transcriptional regulator [Alicycliphilus denitrificans]|uniref:IclR family transcriptional regulator n=1 Tax=Alicycliphilus denitrificans TaxID=179636 RepID=A0A3R7IFK9_9BURK|nr:helix-turn-helix domain-containing protein [Alicycliphilus denitrificans]RKJ96279.1 IclR family transcriptional regulator [Alicycliphilus denitrificans]
MPRTRTPISLPSPSLRDRERDFGDRSVKSARRVFELVELFEQIGRPATVADVVQLSGIPQSSASMLLRTLADMGYLCWNPEDRRYTPSLRLSMLGGWVYDQLFPHSNLRLAMQALCRRTGVYVLLGQRVGRFVQYVHEAFPSEQREDGVPVGMVRPLVSTGLGYSLLAALPRAQARRAAQACFAAPERQAGPADRRGVQSVEEAMALVEQVDRQGYAYSTRLQNEGRASFSFHLGRADAAHAHSGLFGIALAGRRRQLQACLPTLAATVNGVAQEFLPDVQIALDPLAPIEAL